MLRAIAELDGECRNSNLVSSARRVTTSNRTDVTSRCWASKSSELAARRRPSWRTEWAIPSRRADQGRDCGAAEIQRIAENAPRWPDM